MDALLYLVSPSSFTPSPNFCTNTNRDSVVQRLTDQHKMPARWCTQEISLTADTSDNSSSNVSKYNREVVPVDGNLTTFQTPQGLNLNIPPLEKTHISPGACKPNETEEPNKSNLPRPPQPLTIAW